MKFPALFIAVFLSFIPFTFSFLLTVEGDQLPYYQTFDSWDPCYFDGTCYETQCQNYRGGFFSVGWRHYLPVSPAERSWWIIAGQTPTNWNASADPVACSEVLTGPCYDHTQDSIKGKWVYVESTGCADVEFHFISPTIQYTNTTPSFSFWYYMYGSDISSGAGSGSLAVYYSTDNGTVWNGLTTVTGQQQTSSTAAWLKYSADLTAQIGTPSESSPVPVVFRWIATTGGAGGIPEGDYFLGDFGIDDVLMTQDGAPLNYTAWIDPNCTFTGTCNPLVTTSGSTVQVVTGGSGGDGLSDGDIAGIVVGIVGGAILLCCLLLLLLLILLFVISPRKPPDAGGGGEGV